MKFIIGSLLLSFGCLDCFALDREAFTFTHYNLEVRVEPEQQRLGVRGKVALRNDSGSPQKIAVLQISSSLDWRSIRVSGKPVQFVSQPYTSDIDHTGRLSEAIVTLPQEIPPKGTVEMEIGYEGVAPLDSKRFEEGGVPEGIAKHIDWDQISADFSTVRGIGHVVWYPVATEAGSLVEGTLFDTVMKWKVREADSVMQVRFSVPGTETKRVPTILANATECKTTSGKGRDSEVAADCSFNPVGVTEPPMFLIADWRVLPAESADVYYLPGNNSVAETYAGAADVTMPMVREWFGAPQKRAKIIDLASTAAVPFEGGGALMLVPLSQNTDSRLAAITLVHALTHAAFYSPRPWMEEGLAHFAQALWREQESGKPAALDFMASHQSALVERERVLAQSKESGAAHSLTATADEEFYRTKAAYVWWMLRDMVGESPLKNAIAAYRADQDKEPAYMQHLIEAQAKRDLGWFFDEWVYHDQGLPDFRVASVYSSKTAQGYLVTITVENLGAAGAEVPVILRAGGREVTKQVESRGKGTSVIRMEVPSEPQEVVVNDGSVPESDVSNNTYKVEAGPKTDKTE